jgi:hypothetical protein
MRAVRRSSQGDHKGAPLLWTSLASRFVGIVGAHPCGRPAGVPMRLSSLDQPMEQLVGINAARVCPYYTTLLDIRV